MIASFITGFVNRALSWLINSNGTVEFLVIDNIGWPCLGDERRLCSLILSVINSKNFV